MLIVVSHAIGIRASPRSSYIVRHRIVARTLLGHAIFGFKALFESLGVLVRSMLGEQFAICGALEGLEARLALDAEGGGVLVESAHGQMKDRLHHHSPTSAGSLARLPLLWWHCARASAGLCGVVSKPVLRALSALVPVSITHFCSLETRGECVGAVGTLQWRKPGVECSVHREGLAAKNGGLFCTSGAKLNQAERRPMGQINLEIFGAQLRRTVVEHPQSTPHASSGAHREDRKVVGVESPKVHSTPVDPEDSAPHDASTLRSIGHAAAADAPAPLTMLITAPVCAFRLVVSRHHIHITSLRHSPNESSNRGKVLHEFTR
jgi:hypothetical protein